MAGRSHLLAGLGSGLLVSLALGACFIEPAAPATFRFQCSSDSECSDAEVCSNGLCQQPCGGDEDDPCPQDDPVCLNGYCSALCLTDDDVCSDPQDCVSLAAPGEDPGSTGVCTIPCSDSAPCPDGQACLEDFGGLCVATCTDTSECGSGEECLAGFCVPSDSGGGSFP